jgi:acyl-CoA synthetase (AMP-forming)/AMP-acid ligase II
VKSLLALDLPLGPSLEIALRECVAREDAFCIIDQRLSARRREVELEALGATAVLNEAGRRRRPEGRAVDDDIGLVMLTSGSSGPPKAAELTWAALSASAELTQSTLRSDSPPVWFPCLPANHIGGLAVLLRAILADASLSRWWRRSSPDTTPAGSIESCSAARGRLVVSPTTWSPRGV